MFYGKLGKSARKQPHASVVHSILPCFHPGWLSMNKNSSIAIIAGVAIAIAVIGSVFAFSGISNDSTPMDTPDQANLVPQEEKITVCFKFIRCN